jgi:hypothetical protein
MPTESAGFSTPRGGVAGLPLVIVSVGEGTDSELGETPAVGAGDAVEGSSPGDRVAAAVEGAVDAGTSDVGRAVLGALEDTEAGGAPGPAQPLSSSVMNRQTAGRRSIHRPPWCSVGRYC